MKTADDITTDAVMAALAVIDEAIPGAKRSGGPLGDHLAGKLHQLIEPLINQHWQECADQKHAATVAGDGV